MQDTKAKSVLNGKIHIKRREMYVTAKHFGLRHERTIACSQELDILLNLYQGIDQSDALKHNKKNHMVYV